MRLHALRRGTPWGFDGAKIAKGLRHLHLYIADLSARSCRGAVVVDDYAAPPDRNQVYCTRKRHSEGKLYVVFQPHTYTRTMLLLDEFTEAFDDADEIIVTDIYAAREKDNGKFTHAILWSGCKTRPGGALCERL